MFGFINATTGLPVDQRGPSQSGDKEQIINVTDLICEGPIKGLVGEEAGIYLNDSPAIDAQFAGSYTSDGKGDAFFPEIYFSGTSLVGTSSAGFSTGEDFSEENRVLQIQNYQVVTITVNPTIVTIDGVSNIFLERSSGTFSASAWDTNAASAAGERRHILSTDGYQLAGTFSVNSTDNTKGQFTFMTNLANDGFDVTKDYTLTLRQGFFISSIQRTGTTGTGVTLRDSGTPAQGTYEFKILPAGLMEETGFYDAQQAPGFNKVDKFSAQFVDGSLFQNALDPVNGVGGVVAINGDPSNITNAQLKQLKQSYADTRGITILDSGGYPQGQNSNDDGAAGVTVLPANAFGLTNTALVAEADEVSFTIQYPALQTIRNRKSERGNAYAWYEIKIFIDGVSTNWSDGINVYPQHGKHIVHKGNTSTGTSFQHVIGLNQYRPFTDFEIQVARITRHAGLRVHVDGTRDGQNDQDYHTTASSASITSAGAIIRDKFRYPYSSVASLTFSSKKYSGVPKRSYDLQGLKVQIPDTYTPREYSTTDVATYTGFWGGAFKDELFYTDNPAWVFYDIVTNNRYGAGQWIKADDIDKYALYRVAKYCDELVPDGKGGTEPRFRANLYLTKATDVYKVLKDIASIFTGMIYWMDGQVTAVQDTPADPIYTFSKSNVIEGKFSYESTGSKTRANQVVVTWNDPTANYEPTPVIVEDRENIVRKGRIISESAVAFGATSEGQAIRYGRWKLWTALNQTEVVSFTTGLQGTYIKPGDIINVQDADRYGVSYSGRVSSYTPGTLVLDREVAFTSGSDYTLSTLVTEPAAFYAGYEAVTIGSTTYNRGERIPQAYVDADETGTGALALTTLNTEARATNAFANSSGTAPLEITWQEYSYVQSQSITNPAATTSTLSVTTDVAVVTESIWALTEVVAAGTVLGSAKKYRVMGVSKQEETNYAISAVEYYDEKFDAVDTGYELGSVPASVYPEKEPESVPAPTNIYVVLESNAKTPGEELQVFWDKPDNYEFIAGYELSHTAPDIDSPISITGTSHAFAKLRNSIYTFRVRTVSSKGNKSPYTSINYRVEDIFDENIQRVQEGIPKGIIANSTFLLSDTNRLRFSKNSSSVVSKGASLSASRLIESPTDNINVSSVPYGEYSVLFADSTLDLVYYDTTTLPEIPHWVRLSGGETTYAAVLANKWTLVGTPSVDGSSGVSCAANSTIVTGVGTSWLTTLKTRDIVIFGSTEANALAGKKGALVTSILSDTEIRIDKTFSTSQTSVGLFRRTFRPDTNNDSIFATISKTQGTGGDPDTYNLEKFITLDPSLEIGKYVAVQTSPSVIQYEFADPEEGTADAGANVQLTPVATITGTATAIGFVNPLFKFQSKSADLGGNLDTTFNSPNNGDFGYDFTIDEGAVAYGVNGPPASVRVQVVESTRQDDIFEGVGTIAKIRAGAAGDTGASVNIVFARAVSRPNSPTSSAGIPSADIQWYDTPPAGTNLLWASRGLKAVGASVFVWTTPFQVEGAAHAEVYIYRINSSANLTGGSYNFTNNTLTVPSDWSKNPPAITADGHTVYVSVGLATGASTATAASITWGPPAIFSQRTDGAPGVDAPSASMTITPAAIDFDTAGTANSASANSYTVAWGSSNVATPFYELTVTPTGGTSTTAGRSGGTSVTYYKSGTPAFHSLPATYSIEVFGSSGAVTADTTVLATASAYIGKNLAAAPGAPAVSLTLTATPVLFTFDGTAYDPGSDSELSLSAFGGNITGVTWTNVVGGTLVPNTSSTSGTTFRFADNRTETEVKASGTVTANVTGTDSAGTTGVSFGSITVKIATSLQGLDGSPGGAGFFFLKRNNTTVNTGLTAPDPNTEISNPSAGNIAIVENSANPLQQAAWKYTTLWESVADFFRAEVIAANAIGAEQLAISNDTASGAGIYMNATTNRIEIRDASSIIRVKLGQLT